MNPEDKQSGPDQARTESAPPPGERGQRLQEAVPSSLPVLPLGDVVLFPGMVVPLIVSTAKSIRLIDDVVAGHRYVVAVLQRRRDMSDDQVGADDLYDFGCLARVVKMLKFPDETTRILIQGIARCKITRYVRTEPYLVAGYAVLREEREQSIELEALARNAAQLFQQVVAMSPTLPDELKVTVLNVDDYRRLADLIAANLNMGLEERQELLEEFRPRRRLEKLTSLLNRELEILQIGSEIQTKVSESLARSQREHLLREQLNAIKRELGEYDRGEVELAELEKRIRAAGMSAEAHKEALRELERLRSIPPASPEYAMTRTYLDWLVELPWSKETKDELDVHRAHRILDDDHYDLDKVKERILEFLAVLQLKQDMKGPILCFVGPPGVGKTSLGQSIARALGRKFIRMSLGGMRDEAEIRGHRRTYIGALPGRIIQGLRRVGTRNPVFMLDEVDKVGADFRGDPSAALLEVLDPEQNHSFTDHYLGVPFDLSNVLFIATANVLDPVPPALRDRMEVLELPGYSLNEKVEIARRFLVPKQLEAHGLKHQRLRFTRPALELVIGEYTREAGVRNLERELANICRKVARAVAEKRKAPQKIEPPHIRRYLGARRFELETAERSLEPGVATGLAWTPTGGDILFIEATRMPGKGRLLLTGSLGEVMKESAQAALSYIRSHSGLLGLDGDFFEKSDFHVHVPAGAIPKDGPSAGLAIVVALASLLTGIPLAADLAMTGEVTLRGKVMPVGGIKEKVLAAARAGIRRMMLPQRNRHDLKEIPAEVRGKIRFKYVSRLEEALRYTLGLRFPRKKKAAGSSS